jgi:hypothetical protein
LFITLNTIIKKSGVKVEPYHPDNAGGLGSIGNFLSNVGYVFFAAGIGLVISYYQSYLYLNLSSLLTIWLYITIAFTIFIAIMAPVIFFLPIYSTHVGMRDYRDKILSKISKEYDFAYRGVNKILKGNLKDRENFLRKLNQLQDLRERTVTFPVWPYNFGNLRKIFGLTIAPIVSAILSQLLAELLSP